jgi:tetratricopeptide (TPR) repeat protein
MAELTGLNGPYDVKHAGAALELIKGSNRGYLAVCDGRRDVCLLFAQGGLRMTWRGLELPSLVDWMVAQGDLRPDEAKRVSAAKTRLVDERQALLDARVSEGRVDKAARSLMGRVALDALLWDRPQCDANQGEPPFRDDLWGDGVGSLRAGSGMKSLVEGLIAKLEDVSGTLEVLSTAEVSVVTTGESKARERLQGAQGSLEGRLLEWVLNKPGVHGSELLETLGCGEIALASLLAALSRLELVKVSPLERDEKVRLRQGQLTLGRSLAELPRRLWLAAIGAQLGDRAGAARHEARAGWLLVDAGRYREALERFGRALAQAPADLEALRGRVHAPACRPTPRRCWRKRCGCARSSRWRSSSWRRSCSSVTDGPRRRSAPVCWRSWPRRDTARRPSASRRCSTRTGAALPAPPR